MENSIGLVFIKIFRQKNLQLYIIVKVFSYQQLWQIFQGKSGLVLFKPSPHQHFPKSQSSDIKVYMKYNKFKCKIGATNNFRFLICSSFNSIVIFAIYNSSVTYTFISILFRPFPQKDLLLSQKLLPNCFCSIL